MAALFRNGNNNLVTLESTRQAERTGSSVLPSLIPVMAATSE